MKNNQSNRENLDELSEELATLQMQLANAMRRIRYIQGRG
jgi:hypothetical protein